jgi:hypothetical protein
MKETMGFSEVLDTNAKSSHKKIAKPKELRSLEIEKGAEGGHTVTHRFKQNDGGPYHESEGPHIFGASEGKKLMEHLKEHMGIKVEGDKDSAAGAAS